MSDENKRTSRGFLIFGHNIPCRHGTIRVQESSLAFEGAHAWLFYSEEGKGPASDYPCAEINVESAKKLIIALHEFVTAAEKGQLTEPAVYIELLKDDLATLNKKIEKLKEVGRSLGIKKFNSLRKKLEERVKYGFKG
jgi:hypothetical protein